MAARSPFSLANLRTRVRDLLKDPTGANWSNAQVEQAVLDEYAYLWSLTGRGDSRLRSTTATMTYPSGAASAALPTTAQNRPIIAVEDFTTANNPIPMELVPWDDLFTTADNILYVVQQTVASNRRYSTLRNDIWLWPAPSGALTLRIGYFPAVDDLATATHELIIEHEPAIYWGAAYRLMALDSEESPAIRDLRNEMRESFIRDVKRMNRHRPIYIRMLRQYY